MNVSFSIVKFRRPKYKWLPTWFKRFRWYWHYNELIQLNEPLPPKGSMVNFVYYTTDELR